MRHIIACVVFLLLSITVNAQEILNNETILKLVKAGIGEDVIVGMINQQQGKYALSADDVIALKRAGVSDKVVAAMISRSGAVNLVAVSNAGMTADISSQPVAAISNYQPSAIVVGGTIRVYVSDSQSWEIRGGWSAAGNRRSWGGSGYQAGGARPQTAEIIKTFNQRCPEVTVTNNVEKADFAVLLDHEGGKGYALRRNKIAVFNRGGDVVFSDSTRSLGNCVKDACVAILRSAASGTLNAEASDPRNTFASTATAASTHAFSTPAPAPTNGIIDITFTSTPANALVSIGGMALGRTPFTTKIPLGYYKATFSVYGYANSIESLSVGNGYPTTVNAMLQANSTQ